MLRLWSRAGLATAIVASTLLGAVGAVGGTSSAWATQPGPYPYAVPFRSDGVLSSAPATVYQPSFGHVVFVVGAGGLLYYSSDYSGWVPLGAPPAGIVGDPAAVSWADGRIDVFVRGGDNKLWQIFTVCGGCQWLGWLKPVGDNGILSSSPAATSWAPGRIDVFASGIDGQVYQLFWDSHNWNGWLPRGGPPPGISDRPAAASWGPGRVDVFVRGEDNKLWQSFWTGSSWTGWFMPPGTEAGVLSAAPAAGPWGAGLLDGRPRLSVFVRGIDGHVYQTTWDGAWAGWVPIGATTDYIVGAPSVPTNMQHEPDVIGRGTDNRAYQFLPVDPLAPKVAAASAWAYGRAGIAGFTVIDLATGEMASGGYSTAVIRSASVIKVPIAMQLENLANSQHRGLTPGEWSALQLMITQSDNNAASQLWNEVGGGNVIGLMRALGATTTSEDPGGAWGFTNTTSRDLAMVLARLAQGVLGPSSTNQVISLMRQVIPSQNWGIGAAVPGAAIKNGWFPDPGDWRVNCLGIAGAQRYALAIMTQYPVGLGQGYGEATCQQIAADLLGGVGPSPYIPPFSQILPAITGRGMTADGG